MQDGMHVMQELSFPEGHSRALSSAHLTVRVYVGHRDILLADPRGTLGIGTPLSVQFLSFPYIFRIKILSNDRFLPQTEGLAPSSGKS